MQLDYPGLGVQQVWECTGAFLTRAALQPYFEKGVPKVVVGAPVKDPEPVLNIVMGCNHVSCCCYCYCYCYFFWQLPWGPRVAVDTVGDTLQQRLLVLQLLWIADSAA